MFNSFGEWDDEGYLLITLKAFTHHGGLYTHVYSTFGPFYFEVFSTIFTWWPVTLDNGRVVTLVVVLLASLGFGVAIQMFTLNLLAGVATQMGTFVLLILSFVDESMHPMMLAWLLLAIALIALALVARGRRTVGCIVLGATVAALVLTVVNVGTFAAIALLFTGLALGPSVRETRILAVAAAALFVASPFLLMVVAGGHSSQLWAIKYSLIVGISAAGVVVTTLDERHHGLVHISDAYRFILAGLLLGAVVVGIAFLSGTRPIDLVHGVFIDPAHFSNAFTIRLSVSPWVDVWGAVCLAGALLNRRYRRYNATAGLVDTCVHMAAGSLILYCAITQGQANPPFVVSFTVALPLLFFAAIPPVGASDSERIARVAAASLAVLEGLLAYPVAGAQVKWCSLLSVPAGMLCLHDGVRQLRPALAAARYHYRRITAALLASVLLFGGLAWLVWVFVGNVSLETSSYRANTPVTLLGSDMIRLPAGQARTLESLSQAIRTNCSTFVAVPALDSLYFWTDENPPANWFNVWFYTLDRPLQKQIVHNLEGRAASRFCVVDNPYWASFWAQGHVLPQLPLARLAERFRRENGPPMLFDGYQLFVSHGTNL